MRERGENTRGRGKVLSFHSRERLIQGAAGSFAEAAEILRAGEEIPGGRVIPFRRREITEPPVEVCLTCEDPSGCRGHLDNRRCPSTLAQKRSEVLLLPWLVPGDLSPLLLRWPSPPDVPPDLPPNVPPDSPPDVPPDVLPVED
jgi:hypothetical protein